MAAATEYEVGQLQKKKKRKENGTADLQSKASSVLTQKRRKCFVWKNVQSGHVTNECNMYAAGQELVPQNAFFLCM